MAAVFSLHKSYETRAIFYEKACNVSALIGIDGRRTRACKFQIFGSTNDDTLTARQWFVICNLSRVRGH